MVALVRQMLVIDETLKPVATPVTQKVQFRVYRKVGGRFQDSQSVFEYVMRRRAVLSDASGGLHVVAPDEREHQLTHHDGADAQRGRAPVVLSTCAACHSSDGIFSINAYTRLLSDRTSNPQLLPASNVDYQGHATADWKQLQFNWGLLIGLIQGQER
jgi:cytochrome c553